MMPLTMAKVGEQNTIKRIGGGEKTKKNKKIPGELRRCGGGSCDSGIGNQWQYDFECQRFPRCTWKRYGK